ncbi:MAG: TonB-dependent receptor [Archangiaceae bacterium]|nr:TonB-dependent receptor [Archangiaceae bacterium]
MRLGVLLVLLAATARAQDAGTADVAPPEQLSALNAPLPEGALDAGATADVALELTVDDTGHVTAADAIADAPPVLLEAARAATLALTFRPATLAGQPVTVKVRYVVHFEGPRPLPTADAGWAAHLTGRVTSKGTRDAVSSASLFVDDAGTPAAETGPNGDFELWLEPGKHTLSVRAAAHAPGTFEEELKPREELQVAYRLVRTVLNPYETVVRDTADRAEQARVQLSGPELREVAGTQGEPLRVIMLLPGVTTPLSGISYPIVRGASPAATGFFLDDVQIPQLYHLLLGPSVIYPDFIDRVDFYSSNAPVRFGRVTAGVVSAAAAKSRDDRVHVSAYVDVLNAGAFVEVPIEKTGTNIAVAGRVSYTGLVLSLVGKALAANSTPVADFYDYQARVEQKVGRATLRLLAFGSSDLVGSRADDPMNPSSFVTSLFHRADLRALIPLGPGTLEAGATVGFERQGLFTEQLGQTQASFLMSRLTAGGRLRYRFEKGPLQVKVGADLERQQSDIGLELRTASSLFTVPRTLGVFGGAFAELAFVEGPLTVVAGVRGDSYLLAPSLYRFSVDPRLEARYRLTPWLMAHAGAGLFHQAPLLLINLPVTDAAALADGLHEVAQLSAGVEVRLPWGLELHLDGFYNALLAARERSLQQFASGISTLDDRLAATRTGRSYGLEVMLRAPAKGRLFGWLSYSLMRSERLRRFGVYTPDQTLAEQREAMLPFAFDQTHVLNLVAGYQLPWGVKVSGTFHVNSGRPESGEFSSRTARLQRTDDGLYVWQVVPLDQVDRLPPFWRLDLRVSKTFLLNEVSLELYLDVLNVAARQEVVTYSYGYAQLAGVAGATVLPTKTPQGIPLLYPSLGLKGVW